MKKKSYILMLLAAGVMAACGQKQDQGQETEQSREEAKAPSEIVIQLTEENQDTEGVLPLETVPAEAPTQERGNPSFGDGSIPDQTFEVELSEYDGKVMFVPFAPSNGRPDFHMEIIQNGNVLIDIPGYVPEGLSGETFTSLDAVSFYDVNYDGFTDLVLIETYGNTSFAAVYYGFDKQAEEDYDRRFYSQSQLSENITREAPALTVSGIRELMSGGKRNGQFADYREAYKAAATLCRLEGSGGIKYDLIYFDQDQIPELAADLEGYHTSLYTYENGSVHVLMDKWGYGAMGNAGYEYAPGKNSMRNYNTDYAGAILHTTYMSKNSSHTLETVARIDFYNFDDVNQNGIPDEDEMGSMGLYGKSYLNGREATDEECGAWDVGGYEFIRGILSFEELTARLRST